MIDKHDPRLTDYVLGELGEQESARIEAAIQASDELKHAVAEIQQAKIWLNAAFESEPDLSLSPEQRASILESARRPRGGGATPIPAFSIPLASHRWLALATVAALMGLLVGGVFYFNRPGANSRTNSVALNEERNDQANQESAGGTDVAVDTADDEAIAELEDKVVVSELEGSASKPDSEIANRRRKDANSFDAAPGLPGTAAPTLQPGELSQAPAPPSLADKDQQSPPAAASGQAAGSAKGTSLTAAEGDTVPPAMDAVMDKPQPRLATAEASDPAESPLADRSLREYATAQVVKQTRELLDQSELRLLNLQVTTRQQQVETPLSYGKTAFQQKQRHRLFTPQEQGSEPWNQTYLVNQSVRQRVELTIKHQIIEPVVSIAPQDARALVDRLASAVDPDKTQVLKLENLLAMENPIDWGIGSSPSLAQSDPQSSQAVGGYSSKEQVTKPLDRATFRFVQTLNSFIDSRTLVEGDDSIIAPSAESETIVLEKATSQTGEPQLAAADNPTEELPASGDPSAVRMRASQTRKPERVVPIPLLPQSIEQLDFSPIIERLQFALKQRNDDVEQQRLDDAEQRPQNPNK